MLQGAVDDPNLKREIGVIDEHARRASEIISELLEYAKPDPPHGESIELTPALHRRSQRWQRLAPDKLVQIDLPISDANLRVFADRRQLEVALDAIVANAVAAYTREHVRVIINSTSRPSDDTIVVSIGDSGCGMSPETAAHAFDPFFSHRPAGRGRGLGLSRAARLIELNRGRVWIDSAIGLGTTVHLALPARAPELA
jgi:signal transduction histidine kinase